MSLLLGQLRLGKVDGKHEYLTPQTEREHDVFDAYLVPDSVDPERMHNGDIFFVEGFRGTGKTSLLRWHAENQRLTGAITDFVLFKTDLTEVQRLQISKEVGVSWTDIDSSSMEIAQDFKSAWTWFILHKFGELIRKSRASIEEGSEYADKAIRLLGLDNESIFKKAIGFMPKLEGAMVRIRGDVGFFEAELQGDFKKSGTLGETSLEALNQRVQDYLSKIFLSVPLYLYFDELEAFYHTPEQHRRDQRMVRDLLFSVSSVNDKFRMRGSRFHTIAAVRSEVIDNMGSLGQEVDRLVHDRGFHISWHHANRSVNHPLLQIISKKLNYSEKLYKLTPSIDAIDSYFSKYVHGQTIDAFLLDKSFYKPRDIIWRLSIAQKLFPKEHKFTDTVLHETETEYSSKLWDEIRYELSATYSETEIDGIEGVLSGGSASFELSAIEARFENYTKFSHALSQLLARRSVREMLSDLYRLGAIGNSFRVGSAGTDVKNRWAFRGDPNLLADKRMVIHPALLKRLSAVATRRRGR